MNAIAGFNTHNVYTIRAYDPVPVLELLDRLYDINYPTVNKVIGRIADDIVLRKNIAYVRYGKLLKQTWLPDEIRTWLELRQALWSETVPNITVNTGLDDILDKYWKGSAYTAAHYVGLASSTPTFAAADTMASHAGWTEPTTYSESVRQTLTLGTVASQSVDNSASKAVFSINGTVTVGGAFITTNNTKGGTTGTLIGGAALTEGNRSLINGDTLNVQATLTAASA